LRTTPYYEVSLESSTNSINIDSKVFEYLGEFALVTASESSRRGSRDEGRESSPETFLRDRVLLLHNYFVNNRHVLPLKSRGISDRRFSMVIVDYHSSSDSFRITFSKELVVNSQHFTTQLNLGYRTTLGTE
jgi:hypothetical protein